MLNIIMLELLINVINNKVMPGQHFGTHNDRAVTDHS